MHKYLWMILAIFLLNACNKSVDKEAERKTLLNTDKEWAAAAKAGDVKKIVTFWAGDAIDYFPNSPAAVGKNAILELVKKNRSIPGFSLSWEPMKAEVATSADLGYTSGVFRVSMNDADGNPVNKSGNYVCIWKKQKDNSWKCIVETSVFGQPLN
jgi:ketosteroid isomerase-like protein